MFCKYCGKQIPDDANVCPYCGKETHAKKSELVQEVETKKTSDSAPQIFGILSIVAPFIGVSFVGIILAIIGLCIDKNKAYKGLNVAGLIISIIILILTVVLTVVYFVLLAKYIEENPGVISPYPSF